MKQLQALGWDWRDNGVILTVQVDGRKMSVFVPIRRVWVHFENELQAVGCPGSAAVGCAGPMSVGGYPQLSVGGFFDFVKKAVRSAGAAVQKVVPRAIQRAASKVVSTAKRYGGAALRGAVAIGRSPVFRGAVIAASFAVPALAPAALALETANRLASHFQQGLQAAKLVQQGLKNPRIIGAVAQGVLARKQMSQIINDAKGGHGPAQQIIGAFRQHLVNAERRAPGGAHALTYARSAIRSLPQLPRFA